eukprot:3480571-Amphidinium_carterae.3
MGPPPEEAPLMKLGSSPCLKARVNMTPGLEEQQGVETPRALVREAEGHLEEPPRHRPRLDQNQPTYPYPWHRDSGSWLVIGNAEEVHEWLQTAVVQPGLQVKEKRPVADINALPPLQREMFVKHARVKEAASVLPSVEEVSEEEAKDLEHRCPERILGSRWILQGFSDPDYPYLRIESPAPELSEIQMALQVMASSGNTIETADFKAALNQTIPGLRAEPALVRVPKRGIAGLKPTTRILRLKREIYGLITGPAGWRYTFTHVLSDLNWRRHLLSACLFCYFGAEGQEQEKATGWMLVLVDDLIMVLMTAGQGSAYRDTIKQLREKFTFGKWEGLRDHANARVYGGRSLKQFPNGDVEIDVTEYVSKVGKIQVEQSRSKEKEAMASEREVHEFRLWLAMPSMDRLVSCKCGRWKSHSVGICCSSCRQVCGRLC